MVSLPDHDDAPAACVRVVDLDDAGLACGTHPGTPRPWARVCDLPVASVCASCARRVVPIRHRFSWSFLCGTCSALDRAIAAPYGAAALTPHHGQADEDRGALWARLFPDRAPGTRVSIGRDGDVHTQTIAGTDAWHARLGAHRTAAVAAVATAAGLAGTVEWTRFAAAAPTSPEATAAGYLAYVTAVHPWVDSVEPRVADLAWLTAVVERLPADPLER
ncbi:hypothetical protein [Cellulomonas carbonis]|uniref:Uncharacterized protein n=1 Tax=Cellulomonas carbonis T26 TaxID=947969 RepID=A0A0A0C085_9CELL|nr:hypothetical protein [Cellulomonas carbonis]KGM12809.1 hypothetical protein N868_00045 [Cellulomonas carbonis T26]GGC13745.1 hypothetical protein GCM10010972_28860 [Cellulomonas carbonis]